MIVLPEGAFTVIADKAEAKTVGGIILPEDVQKQTQPDTGMICYTSEELNKYQGMKVRFRISFAEELEIDNTPHLYFRDFDSSIYYLIKE